jgi:putative transposase
VRKKDGSLRICVDYRELNAKAIKDTYPLLHMDKILNSVGGCSFFLA